MAGRWLAGLMALMVSGAGCGGDEERAAAPGPPNPTSTAAPPPARDDLVGCLFEAGFRSTKVAVTTVDIEGAQQVAVAEVPGRRSEYVVVYRAPDAGAASRAAEAYRGGAFAEAVGDRIYTFTGDVPTAEQKAAVRGCLG